MSGDAGSQYKLVVAGNIDRDGQIVEAWQGEDEVAELFSAYRTNEITFWCEREIPLSLVETMIAAAIDHQPAANTYKFLLRKD